MRIVKVEITSADKSDNGPVSVITERNRGGVGFVREDASDLTVNEGGPKTFSLMPGQRLVVEVPPEDVVYDRDQGASVRSANQKDPQRADAPTREGSAAENTALQQDKERREATMRRDAEASGMAAKDAAQKKIDANAPLSQKQVNPAPETSPQAAEPKSGAKQEGGTAGDKK